MFSDEVWERPRVYSSISLFLLAVRSWKWLNLSSRAFFAFLILSWFSFKEWSNSSFPSCWIFSIQKYFWCSNKYYLHSFVQLGLIFLETGWWFFGEFHYLNIFVLFSVWFLELREEKLVDRYRDFSFTSAFILWSQDVFNVCLKVCCHALFLKIFKLNASLESEIRLNKGQTNIILIWDEWDSTRTTNSSISTMQRSKEADQTPNLRFNHS